jgi:hypothetical protein
MSSTASTLDPGNPILGVFGYLDATLAPELLEEAAVYDLETVREHLSSDPWPHNSVRTVVRKTIFDSFRLQHWGCPLRKELSRYRLYYRGDMADALTAAYFMLKRGGNPIDALEADYSLKPYGILTWEDIDKYKAVYRPEFDVITGEKIEIEDGDYLESIWQHFSSFHEEGDRLIRYRWPSSSGFLMVRGDRLVWEYETAHMLISAVSLRWKTDYEHFLALGGSCGFIHDDFVWPDPNWVNPVSDEEECRSLGKTTRVRLASGSSEESANELGDGWACSLQ